MSLRKFKGVQMTLRECRGEKVRISQWKLKSISKCSHKCVMEMVKRFTFEAKILHVKFQSETKVTSYFHGDLCILQNFVNSFFFKIFFVSFWNIFFYIFVLNCFFVRSGNSTPSAKNFTLNRIHPLIPTSSVWRPPLTVREGRPRKYSLWGLSAETRN